MSEKVLKANKKMLPEYQQITDDLVFFTHHLSASSFNRILIQISQAPLLR